MGGSESKQSMPVVFIFNKLKIRSKYSSAKEKGPTIYRNNCSRFGPINARRTKAFYGRLSSQLEWNVFCSKTRWHVRIVDCSNYSEVKTPINIEYKTVDTGWTWECSPP